jgi:hypothetical protein
LELVGVSLLLYRALVELLGAEVRRKHLSQIESGTVSCWHSDGVGCHRIVSLYRYRRRDARFTAHPGYLTAAALLVFAARSVISARCTSGYRMRWKVRLYSARIHAATMVAAGVYMLVRVGFLIDASPVALHVVAWIGTITAVLAALMATQQNDIKRILAYSTLSQLGYMVMAVGLASGQAAMFHLFTHAAFKALLFLGAGSIIFVIHHEQDIGGWAGSRNGCQSLSHFPRRHSRS